MHSQRNRFKGFLKMNTLTKILLSSTVGALIGASVVWLLNSPNDSETTAAGGDRKPL